MRPEYLGSHHFRDKKFRVSSVWSGLGRKSSTEKFICQLAPSLLVLRARQYYLNMLSIKYMKNSLIASILPIIALSLFGFGCGKRPPQATSSVQDKTVEEAPAASPLLQPGELKLTIDSDREGLQLSWEPRHSEDIKNYQVFRSQIDPQVPPKTSKVIASSPSKAFSRMQDPDVVSGNTYYYRVCVTETKNGQLCGAPQQATRE